VDGGGQAGVSAGPRGNGVRPCFFSSVLSSLLLFLLFSLSNFYYHSILLDVMLSRNCNPVVHVRLPLGKPVDSPPLPLILLLLRPPITRLTTASCMVQYCVLDFSPRHGLGESRAGIMP
jgi:hypothetical protein